MSAVLEAAKPADELLQACAAYHRVHADYIGPYVSDAHTEKLAEVRGEALACVVALPAHTPADLQAKTAVALSAIMLDVDDRLDDQPWRDRATPEQTIVIDVLQDVLARPVMNTSTGTPADNNAAREPGADIELLKAYAAWLPWEEERLRICGMPSGNPAYDMLFNANSEGWHEHLEAVTQAPPANSPAGIRAKAHVLKALLVNHMGYGSRFPTYGEKRDDLAYSLVIDMMRAA